MHASTAVPCHASWGDRKESHSCKVRAEWVTGEAGCCKLAVSLPEAQSNNGPHAMQTRRSQACVQGDDVCQPREKAPSCNNKVQHDARFGINCDSPPANNMLSVCSKTRAQQACIAVVR